MKNTSKILIALGAGMAIGGILGVLFAPDKGVNTRQKIAENGKKIAEKFKNRVKAGKEKMEEHLSRVNGELEEVS
ncbi:MAG: YtxH domain-containing protein [Sphingobacteriales bacterium]|nr:YtxH domain-containing protein [Sphingobacteriales bacterium]